MARTFDSPLLPALAAFLLVAATAAKAAMFPAPTSASQPLPALSAAGPQGLTEAELQSALPGH
ncbi:MAG TPA: hypothetical protein VK465_04335, partial [Fibrobacteria bacterium]|nr:hypothetical protein [Fibrobacteria bacterium]